MNGISWIPCDIRFSVTKNSKYFDVIGTSGGDDIITLVQDKKITELIILSQIPLLGQLKTKFA